MLKKWYSSSHQLHFYYFSLFVTITFKFDFFFDLLIFEIDGIVWCITAKRYCLMLFQEEGDEILLSIICNSNVTAAVSQCCISILELLRLEGLTRDSK